MLLEILLCRAAMISQHPSVPWCLVTCHWWFWHSAAGAWCVFVCLGCNTSSCPIAEIGSMLTKMKPRGPLYTLSMEIKIQAMQTGNKGAMGIIGSSSPQGLGTCSTGICSFIWKKKTISLAQNINAIIGLDKEQQRKPMNFKCCILNIAKSV